MENVGLTFTQVSSKAHREGVGLCVADSHTGNHPEGGFTPFETIRRLLVVIGRRSHSGFKGETFELERRGQEMDFRNFMLGGVDGELNFLPANVASEGQSSPSAKSVNNNALVIDVAPLSSGYPSNVVENVAGEASTPLDVDSDSDIYVKELKDATDCHWVVAHVTPPSWKQHLREISIEDKWMVFIVSTTGLYLKRKNSLKQDRVVVVSKVVPDAAMKLIRSDDLGVLIAKLVRSFIIYGRCQAFEEVAAMEEPFVLENVEIIKGGEG
ncbi:hypothetical protein Tco_0397006 [Tanacetum coccineum]